MSEAPHGTAAAIRRCLALSGSVLPQVVDWRVIGHEISLLEPLDTVNGLWLDNDMTTTSTTCEIIKVYWRTAYPKNGNFDNPTKQYKWQVKINGESHGMFSSKRDAEAYCAEQAAAK